MDNRGNITIETSIVLPIFIISIATLMKFFSILNYQNIMQLSVNSTAQSIGRYSYILDQSDEMINKLSNNNNLTLDNEILSTGINTTYSINNILNDEVRSYTEKIGIVNGLSGISIFSSELNCKDGNNDLWVNYNIKFKILGVRICKYYLANRCYFHEWVGESLEKKENGTNSSRTVYITKSGKVYHLSKNCQYIRINYILTSYANINKLRNADGRKYTECKVCRRKKVNGNDKVYVTKNGTKYHYDKSCYEINRDIIEIDISQVGNRKPCSKCGS